MTSTYIVDGASGSRPSVSSNRSHPGKGLSFGGVLRSEWIKLSSLLSTRLTLLIAVVLGLGISLLVALGTDSMRSTEQGAQMLGTGPEADQAYLLSVATSGASFLALIFGVLGVLTISSEYASGMILSTLTAVPKRTPVFVAKAVVLSAISAVTAILIEVCGLIMATVIYPEAGGELLSERVVSGTLGTTVYLVLIALFAFGVAGLLRSTAGGIAVVAAVTFVLPIGMGLFSMTGWEWVTTASNYLPMNLGNATSSGIAESGPEPGYWVSLLSLATWAAATVIPAAVLMKRRDAR